MEDGTGTRAVVMGGSLAGLFAARVLADAYDEVVVVDRDVLAGVEGPRRGCPQGRHINGLLARGQQAMEELYPGITASATAARRRSSAATWWWMPPAGGRGCRSG